MRPRSLAILAGVVLVLGAFVWFFERKLPTTAERQSEEKKVFPGVTAEDVREVTIERPGVKVRLERAGGTAPSPLTAPGETAAASGEWRLVAPLAARADRSMVEGFVSTVLALDKARTLERADPKLYGLVPPAARVTLATRKGPRVLEVGRELPATDQRAVGLGARGPVFAVASTFWADAAKAPGDWRSHQLFPGTREDVERVTLRQAAQQTLLARRGEEPWLEAPITDRADQERWEDLLSAVTGIEAVAFLDRAPAPLPTLGLEPPQGIVEAVVKGRSRPFRVVLGGKQGQGEQALTYATVDGQLITLKAPALETAVARPPQEWRSRSWSTLAVYEVDRLEARDAQGGIALTRADADWKRNGVKIFYGPVSDLLGAIADAKATTLLDAEQGKTRTAGAPALTLRLVGAAGKQQTLTLWPAGADGAAARASGRDAVLLLPPTLPEQLARKLAAVRRAEPLKEAAPVASPSKKPATPE